MLCLTNIIPSQPNSIIFSNGFSFLRFLNADAEILLNIRLSVPDGRIFVNDQLNGAWGERASLALPPIDPPPPRLPRAAKSGGAP